MSVRIETSAARWVSGAVLIGCPGFGLRADQVPSGGEHGAAYTYNDVSLPADAAKEIAGWITRYPTLGTLTTYPDMSLEYDGYTDYLMYQLMVDGDPVGPETRADLVTPAGQAQPGTAVLAITGFAPTVLQTGGPSLAVLVTYHRRQQGIA